MKKFFIYPLLLAFIAGIVAGANYTPGTFLSGWDTLHPEFNFPLAFSRIFTGVWRADQGLGAVAIQSHIADLPRVFLLFLGSFLMPVNLLRYASFLVTLAVGPVGIYWLTEHLLIKQHGSHRHFIAFFCALTYLFNLGTVQHFIVPLEMFAFHYALLPWLLFTGLLTLESGSRKSFLAFTLITLLAAPQAHTATLFYAYFGVFTLFVGAWILSSDQKFRALKRGTMLITAILLLNAYWLLPNIYAVATKSNAVRTSKVNALFSDEAFAKNQKFGTIADAALIKNFLFDWQLVDPKTNAQIDVMAAWSDHLMRHPIALAYGYTVFFLVWTGFVYALWKKQRILLNFAPVFIIPFLMLLNGTWPMTLVLARIKESAPVLGEAMRFSFTKFSILYMAASSLFAGIGLLQILRLIKQVSVIRVTKATIIVLSFYYFLPAFGGNLVHPSMRVNIPPAYFDTFSWFQKQNPDRRVAILPVFSFWNWINYSWGYQGAGFLQFGIPQPILDRDYDRWSPMNENYYWELSQALYSEDATAFDAVLRKYDVHYLLLDENVISRDHGRSLYIDQTKTLLSQIPTITIAKSFGKVTIYERNNEVSPSFVSLKTNLPTVSPVYHWTDNDVAYRELGDYTNKSQISLRSSGRANSNDQIYYYPFRSLFTKRGVGEREFTITETDTAFTLGDVQQATSASITKRDALVFEATDSATLNPRAVVPCGVVGKGTAQASTMGDPGQFLRFTSQNQRGCLSFDVSQLPHKDSYLVAVESRHVTGRPLSLAFINDTAKHAELETYLESQKEEWQKDYFILPPLAPDGLGYTVYISNDAIGNQETINDIKSIKFYRIPYQQLVTLHSPGTLPKPPELQSQGRAISVEHSNPAYFKIVLRTNELMNNDATLVLSQAFDPGWLAFTRTTTFPFFQPIKDHVLVNNWKNGWTINQTSQTVILFFWPQLLEWFGFLLLPIPFILPFLPKIFLTK